jgi:hypothetical protein
MNDRANAGVAERLRRVPRVCLQMRVIVGFPGEPSHDECQTIEVGAGGALLVVPRRVEVGQSLLLINPDSWKQISCRVRNVKQIGSGANQVGVEFATESNNFWGLEHEENSQRLNTKRRRLFSWPTFLLAGLMGLIFLFIARSHRSNPASAPAVRSVFQDAAPEEARLIPGMEDYRLATLGDFDPDAAAWLGNYGQPVSGEIPGAFSAFGKSRAYVFVAKDATWRIVILADGQLRCDAPYRRVAIVARIPKQAIQKIVWADPPPADSEGDGLLIVRIAKDPGSAVVLFLRRGEVVSGTPVGYWQIPLR